MNQDRYSFKSDKKSSSPLEPEEIFLDAARDAHGLKLEYPLEENSLRFIFGVIIFTLLVFGGRLSFLQISNYGDYYSLATNNMIREIYLPAPRGIITDRNGEALTNNIQSFNIVLSPGDFPRDGERREEVVRLFAQLAGLDYNDAASLVFSALKPGARSHRKILANVEEGLAVAIKSREADLPGIIIENSYYRQYQDPEIFSHIVGYIGLPTKQELRTREDILTFEEIGKVGAERTFDGQLRGEVGIQKYEISAVGDSAKLVSSLKPKTGQDVALSVDARMQRELFGAMSRRLDEFRVKKGAAVVLDVLSGEILALLSFPAYDNNLFVSSGLPSDGPEVSSVLISSDQPLFNRALSGKYAPGSTIKPLVAVGALEEEIISPDKNILVQESIKVPNKYNPAIVYVFKDWKAHGWTDMRKAIAVSSNVYFYTIGGGYGDIAGLGVERLRYYFSQFGLGIKTGVELSEEASGFIPSGEWKNSPGRLWLIGDTYNMSIGQGDLLVTPLQMARAVAIIANGGKTIRPTIIKQDGGGVSEGGSLFREENLNIIREGMRGAVTYGSARLLNTLPGKAAGKTGTAQVGGAQADNAWFVGFAPYDDPEIAFAVVIEGGGEGSSTAVPVAFDLLNWYFTSLKH